MKELLEMPGICDFDSCHRPILYPPRRKYADTSWTRFSNPAERDVDRVKRCGSGTKHEYE